MTEGTLFLEVLCVDPRAWLREAPGKSFKIRESVSWNSLNAAVSNCRRGLRPPMGSIARSADGAASYSSQSLALSADGAASDISQSLVRQNS